MQRRAILVLSSVPFKDEADKIAAECATRNASPGQDAVVWYLADVLPADVNISAADQFEAYKRDAGDEACYMVVIMCTDQEAEEILNEE